MKVFVVRSKEAKLGYEVVIKNDDGTTENKAILGTDPKNENILHLPDNPSNRKWLSIKKLEGLDELELQYKESRTLGQRTTEGNTVATRKDWSEFLEGEDKELYLKLVEKAKANKDAQKTKLELDKKKAKLLAELAEYEKQLAELN